ncbi:MAG: nucleotide exchange factor GrpE [Pseudomonadota bacterium]
MADPKKMSEVELDEILGKARDDEPVDLSQLAEEAARADAEAAYADAAAETAPDDQISSDAVDAEELATLQAERDEFRDRFMRALADAENIRKRSDRDRREAEQYGGSKLARDLLPVFDNLSRALEVAPEETDGASKALIEGVELTLRELVNVFGKHGIERISPDVGDKFDPQLHQAMFEAPLPGTKAGDIIQVMTDGFLLHDRLLRPAQVGVSSTPGGA